MSIIESGAYQSDSRQDVGAGDIMTIGEVAEYLKIPRETIYKYVRSGKIPASKLGRHWRFTKDEIDEWLNQQSNKGRANSIRVLVVDDEAPVRSLFCRWLGDAGCDAVSTSNGHEALRLLSTAKFDLVLLDLMMPSLNGVETLKEIRKIAPRAAVVIVTGFVDGELMGEVLETGMVTTLKKPVTKEGLLATRELCVSARSNRRNS